MSDSIKLRRSFFYVPGSYPPLLEGAVNVAADLLCFDLEDSVPGNGKEEARQRVVNTIASNDFAPREVLVRVNGLDTPWGQGDIGAVASLPIDGILLPKVETAETVRKAMDLAHAAGAQARLRIWCQIETPLGILHAERIATSHPGVEGFVIGGADLVESMRARNTPERLPLLVPLTHTILVARAYGLAVIDAIHPNFASDDGFPESCRQAVELGFDGKSVAFARQLPVVNEAFRPTPEAVENARRAVAAAAEQGEAKSGYENSHLAHDRRVLAITEMIEARAAVLG
jgi:citrate lyase subunit beta/citryl-CoA lyase